MVGQALAAKLAQLGHPVILGTRDVVQTLARPDAARGTEQPLDPWTAWAAWLAAHPSVTLATFEATARQAELLINATSGQASLPALAAAGADALGTKVLIDIANPLDFSQGMPPSLSPANTDSLGETIQRTYPNLRVVKTLNTLNVSLMVNPNGLKGPHNLFVSGNDPAAKAEVRGLLQSFGWPDAWIVDFGDITYARATEMLLPIWIRLYGQKGHANFNFYINDQAAG